MLQKWLGARAPQSREKSATHTCQVYTCLRCTSPWGTSGDDMQEHPLDPLFATPGSGNCKFSGPDACLSKYTYSFPRHVFRLGLCLAFWSSQGSGPRAVKRQCKSACESCNVLRWFPRGCEGSSLGQEAPSETTCLNPSLPVCQVQSWQLHKPCTWHALIAQSLQVSAQNSIALSFPLLRCSIWGTYLVVVVVHIYRSTNNKKKM